MAVWNTIMSSAVAIESRFDGEYYSPFYSDMDDTLSKITNIDSLGRLVLSIRKGIFDISPNRYRDKGVPLVRTLQIKSPLLSKESLVYIDAEDHVENFSKTELVAGDIVFTKIGAGIGDVAVLPLDFERYNFSQNVAGASVNRTKISGFYLLAYLATKWGRNQLLRYMMPSGQGKLELRDIKKIKVVRLGDAEAEIGDLIVKAENFSREGQEKYFQAQQLLEAELGLDRLTFNKPVGYVARFSEAMEDKRIDADYFQPQYTAMRSLIRQYHGGFEPLLACCDALRPNIDPSSHPKQIYNYIELSNVNASLGIVDGALSGKGSELPSRARRQVCAGDVIASAVIGSVDKAAIISDEQAGFIASTGFFHLRAQTVTSEYLLMLVRSQCVRMQFQQQATGGILSAVPDSLLKHVIVPKLPDSIKQDITKLVLSSHAAKRKSDELLEQAKTRVEQLIEEAVTP